MRDVGSGVACSRSRSVGCGPSGDCQGGEEAVGEGEKAAALELIEQKYLRVA